MPEPLKNDPCEKCKKFPCECEMSEESKKIWAQLMEKFSDSMANEIILSAVDFPINVSKFNFFTKRERPEKPCLVAIRSIHEKTTRLGIYVGDMPTGLGPPIYHKITKEVSIMMDRNPAIFVPSLMKVIWGYESWWHEIKNEDDLKQITDDDIKAWGKIITGMIQAIKGPEKKEG